MKKKTLHINILQFVIFLLLSTTFFISIIFYSNTSTIMNSLSDKIVYNISKQVTQKNLSVKESIVEKLENLQHYITISDHEKSEDIYLTLKQITHFDKNINSVYIANRKNGFIQYRYEKGNDVCRKIVEINSKIIDTWSYCDENLSSIITDTLNTNYRATERPWFAETVKNRKITYSEVYKFKSNDNLGITVSIPVFGAQDSVISVIGIDVSLNSIANYITNSDISKNGFYYIIDNQNRVIVDKKPGGKTVPLQKIDESQNGFTKELYEQLSKNSGEQVNFKYLGNRYSISKTTFNGVNINWSIIIVIPFNDILGRLYKILYKVWVLVAIIFILSFIFVLWFSKRVTDPIEDLAAQMKYIQSLELEKVTGVDSFITEVSLMSDSILSATRGLNSFRKYIPEELVKTLIKENKVAELGGEKKRLTIMFTDIKKFSKLSENLEPEELTIHLSNYLAFMSDVIIKHKGTVNKYMGDGILSFWGAPVAIENSAELACLAALECQKELKEFNEISDHEGKPIMETRFGIHTGDVIVGNIGTDKKLEYSIIGDSVNVASGIEGMNKEFNTSILISEDTYLEVSTKFECELMANSIVKGRKKVVQLYELKDKVAPF